MWILFFWGGRSIILRKKGFKLPLNVFHVCSEMSYRVSFYSRRAVRYFVMCILPVPKGITLTNASDFVRGEICGLDGVIRLHYKIMVEDAGLNRKHEVAPSL